MTDPWRKEHKDSCPGQSGGNTCLLVDICWHCADCDQAIPLLQKFGKIKGSNILGDRAYGAKKIRRFLAEQGAQYTIPPTKNLLHPWKYDRQTYKRRNVIERCFCRLKDFRRISTRYDKRADSFQAFLFLAASAVIFSILHI